MLNKLFTKLFFAKPTTYCGNKSLILNFDDDAEKFTVIQLSKYSSYSFYIKEENKKKYVLCFEGILSSNETELITVDFDDEDDAEDAIKKVLATLNGKTKTMGKITLNIVFVFLILLMTLSIVRSIMAFFAPVPSLAQLELPPFAAQGGAGVPNWNIPMNQQEALARGAASTNGITQQSLNAQYQEDFSKKMQQAQELMNGNLQNMRDNRDIMVQGGNPYVEAQGQSQQNAPEVGSSANSLINALQGK